MKEKKITGKRSSYSVLSAVAFLCLVMIDPAYSFFNFKNLWGGGAQESAVESPTFHYLDGNTRYISIISADKIPGVTLDEFKQLDFEESFDENLNCRSDSVESISIKILACEYIQSTAKNISRQICSQKSCGSTKCLGAKAYTLQLSEHKWESVAGSNSNLQTEVAALDNSDGMYALSPVTDENNGPYVYLKSVTCTASTDELLSGALVKNPGFLETHCDTIQNIFTTGLRAGGIAARETYLDENVEDAVSRKAFASALSAGTMAFTQNIVSGSIQAIQHNDKKKRTPVGTYLDDLKKEIDKEKKYLPEQKDFLLKQIHKTKKELADLMKDREGMDRKSLEEMKVRDLKDMPGIEPSVGRALSSKENEYKKLKKELEALDYLLEFPIEVQKWNYRQFNSAEETCEKELSSWPEDYRNSLIGIAEHFNTFNPEEKTSNAGFGLYHGVPGGGKTDAIAKMESCFQIPSLKITAVGIQEKIDAILDKKSEKQNSASFMDLDDSTLTDIIKKKISSKLRSGYAPGQDRRYANLNVTLDDYDSLLNLLNVLQKEYQLDESDSTKEKEGEVKKSKDKVRSMLSHFYNFLKEFTDDNNKTIEDPKSKFPIRSDAIRLNMTANRIPVGLDVEQQRNLAKDGKSEGGALNSRIQTLQVDTATEEGRKKFMLKEFDDLRKSLRDAYEQAGNPAGSWGDENESRCMEVMAEITDYDIEQYNKSGQSLGMRGLHKLMTKFKDQITSQVEQGKKKPCEESPFNLREAAGQIEDYKKGINAETRKKKIVDDARKLNPLLEGLKKNGLTKPSMISFLDGELESIIDHPARIKENEQKLKDVKDTFERLKNTRKLDPEKVKESIIENWRKKQFGRASSLSEHAGFLEDFFHLVENVDKDHFEIDPDGKRKVSLYIQDVGKENPIVQASQFKMLAKLPKTPICVIDRFEDLIEYKLPEWIESNGESKYPKVYPSEKDISSLRSEWPDENSHLVCAEDAAVNPFPYVIKKRSETIDGYQPHVGVESGCGDGSILVYYPESKKYLLISESEFKQSPDVLKWPNVCMQRMAMNEDLVLPFQVMIDSNAVLRTISDEDSDRDERLFLRSIQLSQRLMQGKPMKLEGDLGYFDASNIQLSVIDHISKTFIELSRRKKIPHITLKPLEVNDKSMDRIYNKLIIRNLDIMVEKHKKAQEKFGMTIDDYKKLSALEKRKILISDSEFQDLVELISFSKRVIKDKPEMMDMGYDVPSIIVKWLDIALGGKFTEQPIRGISDKIAKSKFLVHDIQNKLSFSDGLREPYPVEYGKNTKKIKENIKKIMNKDRVESLKNIQKHEDENNIFSDYEFESQLYDLKYDIWTLKLGFNNPELNKLHGTSYEDEYDKVLKTIDTLAETKDLELIENLKTQLDNLFPVFLRKEKEIELEKKERKKVSQEDKLMQAELQ